MGNLPRARERYLLIAFAFATIAVVATTAILAMLQLRDSQITRIHSSTQNLVASLNQTVDGLYGAVDLSLAAAADQIAQQYNQGEPQAAAINAYLERHAKRIPRLAFIRATNAAGEVVYGRDIPAPAVSLADRPFFRALKADPALGLYIAKPVVGRITRRPLLTLARAVVDDKRRFIGTVYASIELETLNAILGELPMRTGSSLALRDRDLALVARHTFGVDNPIPVGSTKLSKPFMAAWRKNPQQGSYISDISSLDPVVRAYSYRSNGKYGYLVNVGVPIEEELREWRQQAWIVATLVVIFAVLLLGLTVHIGRARRRLERTVSDLRDSRDELELNHQRLREADQRWRFAIEGAGDGVWDYDARTGLSVYSRRYQEMLGYAEGEFPPAGTTWLDHIHPDDLPRVEQASHNYLRASGSDAIELRMRCKNGEYKWFLARGMVVSRAPDGTVLRIVGTHADISALKAAESQIWNEANYDSLTGLPNRRLFYDRLDMKLREARRDNALLALLFIDLDHFKEVNDTLGHHVGDDLLQQAAQRIQHALRASDTVARLGGDEFTVVLTELQYPADIAAVAEQLISSLSQPFRLGDREVVVSASIGIALCPSDADNVNDLVRNADQAMYAAKASGRQAFRFFTKAMQDTAVARMALLTDLRRALAQDQFEVHYQPVIDLLDGAIVKAEALVRWRHPERGMIAPVEFIPVAESAGIITDIDEWVFNQACRQLARWRIHYAPDFQLSINASPLAFSSARRTEHQQVQSHKVPNATPYARRPRIRVFFMNPS